MLYTCMWLNTNEGWDLNQLFDLTWLVVQSVWITYGIQQKIRRCHTFPCVQCDVTHFLVYNVMSHISLCTMCKVKCCFVGVFYSKIRSHSSEKGNWKIMIKSRCWNYSEEKYRNAILWGYMSPFSLTCIIPATCSMYIWKTISFADISTHIYKIQCIELMHNNCCILFGFSLSFRIEQVLLFFCV